MKIALGGLSRSGSYLLPRSCAVTKVQELFYGRGAEAVDGIHLTVKLFHQIKGAFLVRMDQHKVKHRLLFRREETPMPVGSEQYCLRTFGTNPALRFAVR